MTWAQCTLDDARMEGIRPHRVLALLAALLLAAVAAQAAQATVPGRNGRIVFASARESGYDLFSVAPDGTGLTRLTDHPATDGFPSWSPDGRRIAFSSNRDGDLDVWVMDADGGNVRQVTNGPGDDRDAAWSPDGKQIAFERDLASGDRDVWLVTLETGVERKLTTNPLIDGDPAWSPDGELIAYGSERHGPGGEEDEVYFVFLMRPDGTQLGQLTDVGYDQDPSWSPDGKHVVFESAPDEEGPWDLYILDVETRESRLLLDDPTEAVTPTWSPDGAEISLVSRREGNWEVYTIRPDGTGLRNLTRAAYTDMLDDSAADWQPLGPPPADCTVVGTRRCRHAPWNVGARRDLRPRRRRCAPWARGRRSASRRRRQRRVDRWDGPGSDAR